MTYDEAQSIISILKPGGSIPATINDLMKLVLGKMARRKIRSAQRTAEITTGGASEFLLSTYIPDFLEFKIDLVVNKNRGPYFYQSTEPYFLQLVGKSDFIKHTEGGFCMVEDGTLKVSWPSGITIPTTLYVPIWGKFLVLDSAGGTLKEKPEEGGDTFIFDSVFDDVFIDGVLLYLNRKDLDDTEFTKANAEWNKSLNELVFYQ
jgi:hypothetical protein